METFLMVITLLTAQNQYTTSTHMGEWPSREACIAAIFKVGDKMIKDPTTPWNRSIVNCIKLDEIKVMSQPPNA
jgi:hypothetical protein